MTLSALFIFFRLRSICVRTSDVAPAAIMNARFSQRHGWVEHAIYVLCAEVETL